MPSPLFGTFELCVSTALQRRTIGTGATVVEPVGLVRDRDGKDVRGYLSPGDPEFQRRRLDLLPDLHVQKKPFPGR